MAQTEESDAWKANLISSFTICPATISDYKEWLREYLGQGGEITHVYDYPMPTGFYLAIRDFEMTPFYGAQAIQIIVPRNVKVTGDNLGHCHLYLEDGHRALGGWVPLYSDINFF
jgi:hypothetical protein